MEELRHRLTAILAADIAGYSRLMGADEHATIAALDEVRALFRREAEANAGRVVDTAGDSVLALFETATGALAAALAVQRSLESASASVAPERRMRARIGVHLGEVVEKPDGSVYGNGVNVAARLQSIGRPGGICISQALYDTVRSKMPVQAEAAGPQSFKNIDEPVVAWHVVPSLAGITAPKTRKRSRLIPAIATAAALLAASGVGWWWYARDPQSRAADAKSIAVLPFTNMSEDKANAYFADGVHEDLLTQLAQLGELKVVSRTSVAEYRDTKKNLRQVGTELGVATLVEGSVRRAGNRVRVTVQLIDARSDKHLWANTYDRELKDIFVIQSELAGEIARALKLSLSPREESRLARRPTENLQAYELLLRHQEVRNHAVNLLPDIALKERVGLLSRAIELDPKFAVAWARLAAEHARMHFYSLDESDARLRKAQEALDRALALAPEDIEVRTEASNVYYYGYRDFARAAQHLEEILSAAPNHVAALNQLGWIRRRQGKWIAANALHERALGVDARNLEALATLRENYNYFRHYDRALALQRRMIEVQPGNLDAQALLQWQEYLKTGSFAAYDAWRVTLPPGVELSTQRVWWMDLVRATAKRDFDALLRLLDASPPQLPRDLSPEHLRPRILLAKGDKARAMELAHANLRRATEDLRKAPQDFLAFHHLVSSHAVLGERVEAFEQFRRWVKGAPQARRDVLFATLIADTGSQLYALLGDRDQALRFLREQTQRPSNRHAREWLTITPFLLLRDDPAFQALASDPANSAPLPITDQDPAALIAKVLGNH